jgi:hypothetical protein
VDVVARLLIVDGDQPLGLLRISELRGVVRPHAEPRLADARMSHEKPPVGYRAPGILEAQSHVPDLIAATDLVELPAIEGRDLRWRHQGLGRQGLIDIFEDRGRYELD